MKVGVCVKVTADFDARVKASADGSAFEVTGKKVIGPYDAVAVEAAIQVKEKHAGAPVVTFTVGGGEETSAQLRGGPLAFGADKAVVIADPALAAADSLGIAKALAAAIRREGCDLVLAGRQSIDTDNAQVPAMVAELLGCALVSRVVEFAVEGAGFKATRVVDGGVREVVTGALPAVVTASDELNTPRYPKLQMIMAAKKKPIDTLDLAALGLGAADVAPRCSTTAYAPPAERPKARKLQGDVDTMVKELVRLLREEAKVL